jgi:DNA-binding MarR family transcriptional regulator
MNTTALQDCLARERAQALVNFSLDMELGTHHGIAWADFVLLQHVAEADGGMPEAELAQRLGVLRSRLLMRTRPLEKPGWLQRLDGPERRLVLLPSGQRLLSGAQETAAAVCEKFARRSH